MSNRNTSPLLMELQASRVCQEGRGRWRRDRERGRDYIVIDDTQYYIPIPILFLLHHLLNSDVPASLHVQEAWLILVFLYLTEPSLHSPRQVPGCYNYDTYQCYAQVLNTYGSWVPWPFDDCTLQLLTLCGCVYNMYNISKRHLQQPSPLSACSQTRCNVNNILKCCHTNQIRHQTVYNLWWHAL